MWWRAAIVASILGLWLAIGIAWGPTAALIFGFSVFIAGVFAVWSVVAGGLVRRGGGWYYERQLNRRKTRRWGDRSS